MVSRTPSIERSHIPGRSVRAFTGFNAADYQDLNRIGIEIPPAMIEKMHAALGTTGMDSLTPPMTLPSIGAPIQFLQNWLPGFVMVITQARKIDELVGVTTVGAWEDEEVVQGFMELLGGSVPYGDLTNVPLASYNANYNERTIVRFEEGMRVGLLEEARAAKVKINSADAKREAASNALEVQRNSVGFYGYNAGANYTFGFLNDPNEPGYIQLPATGAGGSTTWPSKTYLQITADIRLALAGLRTASGDTIDPRKTAITLALPTNTIDFLTVNSDFGNSVEQWLNGTYASVRIESAPELNGAHGGANVFYIYADAVQDASTDDGKTFIQMVPTKFRVLGVEQKIKGYEEDYSNATAGVMCKRPYAMARYFGC